MRIDESVAQVVGLPVEVPEADLAARLADLAGANPPTTPRSVELWIELEKAIEDALNLTSRTLDNAEATHYVVSNVEQRTADSWKLWADAFGAEAPDPSEYDHETNPDTRLRSFVMFEMLPKLAATGRISVK